MKYTPVLIGLPGVGKTSVAKRIADSTEASVFSTDPFFRICRALPKGSDDPRREIMETFLDRISSGELVDGSTLSPEDVAQVEVHANATNEEGKCVLADSRIFRSHGEAVFRTYEAEMLKWINQEGLFEGSLPDLSASAPLFPENRDLFSEENGYLPFLLMASNEVIARNLLKDYSEVLKQRAQGNKSAKIRGGYETEIDDRIGQPIYGSLDESRAREICLEITDRERKKRLSRYKQFAQFVVEVNESDTVEDVSSRVLTEVRTHA